MANIKQKIIDARFRYAKPSVPKMAEFVNENCPEWNMEINDTHNVTKAKSYSGSGLRYTEGYTTKGFEITFTKNGMKQQTFDTSSTYHKNKDVAYYIAIWILGYDYQTETYNNR